MGLILEPQRLTSVRIKVRRLGYIIKITKLLKDNPLNENKLIEKLEEWSIENKYVLKIYCGGILNLKFNEKHIPGEISYSKTHNSAKRYVEIAEEMGLLSKITNKFYNTKMGNVLSSLPEKQNPFELSYYQICFFMKLLLEKDYDYLVAFSKCDNNYTKFKNIMIERLNGKKSCKPDMMTRLQLTRTISDIDGWKGNPKKYFDENIKYTRMDWLRDLKIDKLYKNFLKEKFIGNEWLNNEYYKIFCSILLQGKFIEWINLPKDFKNDLIKKYLEKSYNLFGSKYSNKILASQFFEYILCNLLFEKYENYAGILASFSDIELLLSDISKKDESVFSYRKTLGKEDIGYIVRISP